MKSNQLIYHEKLLNNWRFYCNFIPFYDKLCTVYTCLLPRTFANKLKFFIFKRFCCQYSLIIYLNFNFIHEILHHTVILLCLFLGVVRVELVEQPGDYVPTILSKVKKTYMARTYRIPADWTNHLDFLEKLAQKSGKLLKGGEPDINTIAKMILNGNY